MLNMLIQQLQEQTTSTYMSSNICSGAQRPRRPPQLEQRSAASANCSKTPRIAQKSLKTTQNHSKSLRIAQNRNRSNPLQTDSKSRESGEFGVILGNLQSLFLRSRDQHSNICSNICRSGCQLSNKNICSEPFPHFGTALPLQ